MHVVPMEEGLGGGMLACCRCRWCWCWCWDPVGGGRCRDVARDVRMDAVGALVGRLWSAALSSMTGGVVVVLLQLRLHLIQRICVPDVVIAARRRRRRRRMRRCC